jgi:hypothetical protein
MRVCILKVFQNEEVKVTSYRIISIQRQGDTAAGPRIDGNAAAVHLARDLVFILLTTEIVQCVHFDSVSTQSKV